ncbi:MAG: hypothetical protein CL677_06640 [Bdellovibrionaceae bacterium]|nr:hypothetical protein [Pseudobdellovibrionaceae bacterium]|tara:strand:+ start:172 stop:801 length:630 start_codon:yes stop_codon:yes gene_type:complete
MDFTTEEEKLFSNTLVEKGNVDVLQRGQSVYREGDTPKGLYYVRSGLVGLIKVTSNGSESLLRIFKQGQFFGHRSLFSEELYHASAQCLEPTEVVFVPKTTVFSLFKEKPEAYFYLARALAKELRRAENRSVLVSEAQILERVASTLLLFKRMHPKHQWTRTEIANYCASRTPTVIKVLGDLESSGAISQNRREIQIVDESKLLDFIQE